MAISHLIQKSPSKSGKAKTGGLHSVFFNATKASLSWWPKYQGVPYYNKVDNG